MNLERYNPTQAAARCGPFNGRRGSWTGSRSGFTMIEIALCLAIIGIALVAIIGVLPMGMNVQKDNREETIINQDAGMLMDAIRKGARGLDDLTNYVSMISNSWVMYNNDGSISKSGVNAYTYSSSIINGATTTFMTLTNGANIVGLLSTPEFVDTNGLPLHNPMGVSASSSGGFVANASYYSNHIVAYIRSMSGPAVEKPPQNNTLMQQDAFSYRVICVNAPLAGDTNYPGANPLQTNAFSWQLAANLHDVRLRFSYPLQPNGSLGAGDTSYRSLVGGNLAVINGGFGYSLYFYQSQTFTNTP